MAYRIVSGTRSAKTPFGTISVRQIQRPSGFQSYRIEISGSSAAGRNQRGLSNGYESVSNDRFRYTSSDFNRVQNAVNAFRQTGNVGFICYWYATARTDVRPPAEYFGTGISRQQIDAAYSREFAPSALVR